MAHDQSWSDGHYKINQELLKQDPLALPSRSKGAAAAAAHNAARNIHYDEHNHGVVKVQHQLS